MFRFIQNRRERYHYSLRSPMRGNAPYSASSEGTDLNEMLKALWPWFTARIRDTGDDVELSMSLDPTLRHVRMAPAEAESILRTLFLHGLDGMPGQGSEAIETAVVEHRPDRGAKAIPAYGILSVTHTGSTGIEEPGSLSPLPRDRILSDRAAALAHVVAIVQRRGGYLEEQEGDGGTVRLYLPLEARSAHREPREFQSGVDFARISSEVLMAVGAGCG